MKQSAAYVFATTCSYIWLHNAAEAHHMKLTRVVHTLLCRWRYIMQLSVSVSVTITYDVCDLLSDNRLESHVAS